MNQILKLSVILGFAIGIQPAIVFSTKSQTNPSGISGNSNQMIELSTAWGFQVTNCQENVAKIEHDRTGEIACVVPNNNIKSGKYIYDSANNKIREVATETTNISPVQNDSLPASNSTAISQPIAEQMTFNFNNSYDYGICLDAVLLAYEQRGVELEKIPKNECVNNIFNNFGTSLSKETALEIVKAANNYATNNLEDKLYPSFGLRRRIAIALGYVYDFDRNNSEILKYVDSNSN